jgi:hypothetical protein
MTTRTGGASTTAAAQQGPRPMRGPHLVLMALYALFILASGARAAVQIATKFHVAPLAYTLSAVSAVTYIVGWFAIGRAARGRPRLAEIMLWVELAGVAVIGTLSLVEKSWFPDASVWSDYGGGYGWVPAALPVLALLWLHRTHERSDS